MVKQSLPYAPRNAFSNDFADFNNAVESRSYSGLAEEDSEGKRLLAEPTSKRSTNNRSFLFIPYSLHLKLTILAKWYVPTW
jgi:hypothetical protein